VRSTGFDGVPAPIGVDDDGRERLEFVEGDVPATPYPAWAQSDAALASVAALLRRLHDAARRFDPAGLEWNRALADPAGGTVVGHNDVELSNVVFRDGIAVAFIDFEFAAPGRPVYDLAQLARLCVPLDDDADQARLGWHPADRPSRLRILADAYGLDGPGRAALLPAIGDALDRIEACARASTDVETLRRTGGIEKYDRRRRWWATHRADFEAALG
jgi:aminoglycoside phosphotransferase (APT) family kinase protein